MNNILAKNNRRNPRIKLFLTAALLVAAPLFTSCSSTKYESDARSQKPRISLNAPETRQDKTKNIQKKKLNCLQNYLT
ncbi:MAG: hypothetical protein AABW86_01410 [Candidatus Micrarchaeota archaeon]